MYLRVATPLLVVASLQLYRPNLYEELIKVTTKSLPNITVKDLVYDEGSDKYDQGFTGIFGMFHKNESDVLIVAILPESNHFQVADFVYTNMKGGIYILQKFDYTTSCTDLLKMFHVQDGLFGATILSIVWITTILAIKLVNGNIQTIFASSQETHPESTTKIISKKGSGETSFFYYFGLLLCQSIPFHLRRARSRFVSICYQFFVFAIVSSIFANVKTQLLVIESHVIRSIDDLLKQPSDLRIQLVMGENMKRYIMNSSDPKHRLLSNRLKESKGVEVQSLREMGTISKTLEDNSAVCITEADWAPVLVDYMKEDLDQSTVLFLSREDFPWLYAFAIRRSLKAEIRKIMRKRFQTMIETGVLIYFYERLKGYSPPGRTIENMNEIISTDETLLLLQSFYTTFLLWFIGLGLACACFLGEIALRFLKRSKLFNQCRDF